MRRLAPLLFLLLWASCKSSKPTPSPPTTEVISTSSPSVRDSIFEARRFDPNATYAPLSLYFEGKPLAHPGDALDQLPDALPLWKDSHGLHEGLYDHVVDYKVTGATVSVNQPTGILKGNLYFSADKELWRIFHVEAYWAMDIQDAPEARRQAAEALTTAFFPVLKDQIQFENGWTFRRDRGNYTENWRMEAPGAGRNWWQLAYFIVLGD